MIVYNVVEGSVIVRRANSASSGVVNIIPKGGQIYTIGEEAGWLRTISGYYVFKSDNLEIDNPLQERDINRRVLLTANDTQYGPYPYSFNGTIYQGPSYNPGQVSGTTPQTKTVPEENKNSTDETKVPSQDQDSANTANEAVKNQNDSLTQSIAGLPIQPLKVVEKDDKGNYVKNADGSYKLIDAPSGIGSATSARGNEIVQAVDGGKYILMKDKDGGQWLVPADQMRIGQLDNEGNATFVTMEEFLGRANSADNAEYNQSILDQIKSLGERVYTAYTDLTDLTVEDSRTIFGMPYQFMPIVDPRTVENDPLNFKAFGRKFQEKIVNRAPILYIQAGLPIFLRGYSDEAKQSFVNTLMDATTGLEQSDLEKLLNPSNMQYYSFDARPQEYFRAVNSACAALAHLLQIERVQIPTINDGKEIEDSWKGELISVLDPKALGAVNWSMRTKHMFGYYGGAVAFYINSDSQVQESFTNATRTSSLANKINSLSDQAMEAYFLMGTLGGTLGEAGYSTMSSWVNKGADFFKDANQDTMKGEDGLIGSIMSKITTLISGGKMIFPEIWGDSHFARAYTVTIKLDTPETDTVSIFLNILVPLIHILGFVLPRAAGPNMYVSPFLVRCFYKSMFHIDMGIITSCQITKGDTGAWNHDGLPCQVTVELQIKDLYSVLSQASGVGDNTLISNPAQLEYLASLAGINVAPASITRAIELWMAVKGTNRIAQGLIGNGIDIMQSFFKKLQNLSTNPRNTM